MFVDDIKNDILINELQLGDKLNQCIHHKERSQFSLLLAMLTDDVRAHSQFTLPITEDVSFASDEENLRKLFKLPLEQALALDGVDNIQAFNQADLIQGNTLSDLYLTNALKPVPLAFRNDIKFISRDVLDNTSLYCQKKHENKDEGDKKVNSRLSFKAEEWLNTVNESMKHTVELRV